MSRNKKGQFAPGNKVGFKPGETGNPGGRPKVLQELAGTADFLPQDMKKVISKCALMPRDELDHTRENAPFSALGIVAAAFAESWRTGDIGKITPLLDRLLGRVQQEVSDGGAIHKLTIERVTGEKVEMISQASKEQE